MKEWYLRQSPRDRVIVIAVAVLGSIGLLYALVWQPMQTNLAAAERSVTTKKDTLAFVRTGASQLKGRGSNTSSTKKVSDKLPYLLMDQVIREQGVSLPERLEPSGPRGARASFGSVEFDKLVTVIAELELYGLSVETLSITRRDEAGMVSAKITMEKS